MKDIEELVGSQTSSMHYLTGGVWGSPHGGQELAQKVATDAIKSFGDARGIFGVEMFLLEDGSVLLNEIAPRPHNTGHYTMEACGVDQLLGEIWKGRSWANC